MNLSLAGSLTTRFVRPALVVVGLGLLLLLAVRIFGVRSMLFPTWMLPAQPFAPALDNGEIWTLNTDQGKTEALFFPAGPGAPAIVILHGNAELIDHYRNVGEWYQQRGFSVLIPEFRGYGRSRGTPTKHALINDVVAFYDRLKNQPAVDSTQIFFYGRSLGGAIAAAVSSTRPPRALALESTFTSVRQLARERRFPGFLVGNSFDSEAILKDASFPVLLIHGRRDDIVPMHHATRLAASIAKSKVILQDCGHNDCPRADAEILSFFQSIAKGAPAP